MVFSMESPKMLLKKTKPFLAVIFIQFSYAFMSIIAKFALNAGMSPHVLVAYRMAVAAALVSPFALVLERNTRPRMTFKLLFKISMLSLFEPVVEQNLYYTGMKLTTATFTSAMCNVLPALTFVMACIFGLEKVVISRPHSQAKLMGTTVALGGAMLMTFVKGSVIQLPWTKARNYNVQSHATNLPKQEAIGRGAMMLVTSCFSWSCYIILQAKILRSYPAELSLTALMCIMGTMEGTIMALVWERNNTSVWEIHPDVRLLAFVYGGFVSGIAYYVIGWVAKERGPVFVSAFNPLNMVIVAILSSFVFSEALHIGRVVGAVIIVLGIYSVLWGKSKDKGGGHPSKADVGETVAKFDQQKPAIADANKVMPTTDQIIVMEAAQFQESV